MGCMSIIFFCILNFNKKCNLLVLGDLRSFPQILALNLLKPERVIVVDDGIFSSLLFDSLYTQNYTNSKIKNFFLKRPISSLHKNLRLSFKSIFFTTKASMRAQNRGFEILPNKLRLTKNINQGIDLNKAIFIGQDLVELGIMTQNNYLKIINTVSDRMKKTGVNFYYYPHRAESEDNLKQMASTIDNCKFLERSLPIEDYFLNLKDLPIHVFTFYSTAIFSISRLFTDINCTVIYADNSYLKYKNEVNTAYDLFNSEEEIDFENINLND
jgi:hypothetical protein